jgi:hypothetical protein
MTALIAEIESRNDPDLPPTIDFKLAKGENSTPGEREMALMLCAILSVVLQESALVSEGDVSISESAAMVESREKLKKAGVEILIDRERFLAALNDATDEDPLS